MDIHQILLQIKHDYDHAIMTASFNGKTYPNGNKAKEALIRSQKIINLIHESVKADFAESGVPSHMIFPAIGYAHPEVKIQGFLKSKDQDVTIVPNRHHLSLSPTHSIENEKILSVNIRSQLSSLAKNIDTLYERTFAEALNLHLSYPRQCLGEVYLIPTHEYDDKAMLRNQVAYRSVSKIESYIEMFQAINNRHDTSKDEYKYERICLLIVDFRQAQPKLYDTVDELKKDGLVPQDSVVTLEHLTGHNFANDLLALYRSRFGHDTLS